MQDLINLQYTTIKDPLPDFIYDDLKDYSKNANGYKPQPQDMVEALAMKHKKDGVSTDMIYLTAGIDEALQMHIRYYGQKTTIFTPTYTVYRDVDLFGMELTEVPSIKENDYQIEPKIYPDATLIILANPNNPSGFTPREKVIELIKNNPQAIVLIDEAYSKFADLSVVDEVKNYKNLAVLRSFSKDYSMAGNRIGYMVTRPEIIEKVKDMSQWSNVSYLSVGAAMAALKHEDYFVDKVADIAKRREVFQDWLAEKGIVTVPSKINAVLLKFQDEKEGTRFFDHLASHNIIASHGNGNSNIGLDKSFVRIAIGTPDQMQILMDTIEKF